MPNLINPISLLLLSLCLLSACTKPTIPATKTVQGTDTTALPQALVLQRADPQIYRTQEGRYYFIATAPEFDRIELRAADRLADLTQAPAQVIWRKHASGPMSANIWAPELHRWDNTWYIYFAAGETERPGHIRMYVLANDHVDPLQGQWRELGRVNTARDSFSLDATVFEHRGVRYLLWAQKDPQNLFNSALYLATLETPTQVGSREVEISRPDLGWEIQGYKVNEGAAVIKHNGRIFVSYSASATDHRYAMGLLWIDETADILNPAAWNKAPEPVFFTHEKLQRYGPGHNSFTLAEDGKTPVLVYHARDYLELQGAPLTDPNRHTYIRRLQWTTQGFPDFGQERADDLVTHKQSTK
ncbi:glycoside hydrolase family 43 protein [Cellvibrio japonicus]|uniref:Alpha-L-arabinfuranosidase, putative, abf43L n=1 Tax=Cellvibrio japonicus (strain Ueda107) TaxID=498211 RepID=B3PKP9_CELJU|nr:glycoside hydrolase family 43 protein [Cellvibrio japonicus]ACE84379.1 alpha-L-arabinfuranosidase, putative, abf43L [Cellvibrio japonicus Ueda107]QEI11458.1 family 43 glycosylhydrolase [Cellvibrio japonicus]QEI15032.1 family 43 glycosylhydrolase [Cellvibrio japonicus]QEI18612.1 family 43 glycosylhydrolase [Cellvibrio japonicus]